MDEGPRLDEPPHYPFRLVRTRALDAFETSAARPKLLAVVAPVGYGKTVLMSALHARLEVAGERCYWTALDERDTHIEDLLERLEVHFSRHSESPHPTQALLRGDASAESRLEAVVRAAREHARPFTAFVDNLHFCTDPLLGALLDRLLFETPDTARFVVSSTAALPIDLARAKLEGRVRQVGYTELSLDLPGIAELLGPRIVEALGPGQVAAVLQQTEGWPAAARMMQIVMAGARQPRELLEQFSGSDEDLVALLNRQVLRVLPADLRDFLLAISSLHTFDAALCAHATGSSQAQLHLDYLVQHNVFMIPLDRNRRRYRLHGLFRQYLQGEAKQKLGDHRRREILARAAEWCDQAGEARDAIDYALAGNALDIASRILERSAASFVRNRGDTPQYIAWARTLFDQGRTLGWEAEYWYVWALVLNQRYDEGRHHLERLARRIHRTRGSAKASAVPRDIERRLDILRMCIDVFTDRLPEADQKAMRWLESAKADDPFDITVARCIRSIFACSAYQFVAAREAIQAAQSSASQTRSEYARGWTIALTALPAILEGHYPQAYPPLVTALATLPTHIGDNAGICGTIALLAASCAIEMGLDEEARNLVEQGLRTAHSHGFIDALASGLDAALKLWSGEPHDVALTTKLHDIASHYPPRLAFLVSCHRIRRLLRVGRLDDARVEALRIGMGLERPAQLPAWAQAPRGRDVLMSTLIDLQIASGLGRAVAPLVAEQMQWAKADGRISRQIDLSLAEALIELGEHRITLATRHLTRAIVLATPSRIVRPFHDLAPALAALIEDTKPSTWGFAHAEERRFFADLCGRVPMRDPHLQDRLVSLNIEAHILEPLTRRQIELLGLLEAGLTNQQIADRIDRTLTTVKGHLQSLYAKLGVSSRSAALARAKVLKLL